MNLDRLDAHLEHAPLLDHFFWRESNGREPERAEGGEQALGIVEGGPDEDVQIAGESRRRSSSKEVTRKTRSSLKSLIGRSP